MRVPAGNKNKNQGNGEGLVKGLCIQVSEGCRETTDRVQCPPVAVTALRPEGTNEGEGQVEKPALKRAVVSADGHSQPNVTWGGGEVG